MLESRDNSHLDLTFPKGKAFLCVVHKCTSFSSPSSSSSYPRYPKNINISYYFESSCPFPLVLFPSPYQMTSDQVCQPPQPPENSFPDRVQHPPPLLPASCLFTELAALPSLSSIGCSPWQPNKRREQAHQNGKTQVSALTAEYLTGLAKRSKKSENQFNTKLFYIGLLVSSLLF